jgi:pimeloyl-ACP methyl ester carboxylesterase
MRGVPQAPQKRKPSGFSRPHDAQIVTGRVYDAPPPPARGRFRRAVYDGTLTPDPTEITLRNRLTLSYVDQGNPSAPAVVLLHGLVDSWRSFDRVLPHLPASVRAIVPSQRGHGDSDRPETGYRTRDFASDVGLLMDALGLTSAVVHGLSSSSLVAQRFAIDNPGRTAGIVLEGSFATLRGNQAAESVVASAISTLREPIDPDFVRGFQAGILAQPVPQAFLDTLVREGLKVPARVWREAFEGLLQDDHSAELRDITAPTLILWGDRDAVIGRDQQDVLASGIPTSELAVYAGCGHALHWEEPRRFAADLVAFVQRASAPIGVSD